MATTITPSSSEGTSYIAWQDIANGSQVVGSAINVDGKIAIRFFAQMGRRSGTAFTAATAGLPTYPRLRFEASPNASGSDWRLIFSHSWQTGASIANTTLNGAVTAGGTSIVLNAATNIGQGDMLFIQGNTDAEDELVFVKSVASTTITLDDATPLRFNHASGNAVTDQADVYQATFGCSTIKRIRVVPDNANGGQNHAVEVTYTTEDNATVTVV
jgi:hypothetical protein